MWRSARRSLPVHLLASFGLLVVLAQESDQDDNDDADGVRVWHNFCGALGTDENPAPGPLKLDDYEFVGVSMLIRHGARNFLSDPRKHCHPVYHEPSTQTLEEKNQVPEFLRSGRLTATAEPPFVQTWRWENAKTAPTLDRRPAIDDDRRCAGCLLSESRLEFEALGESVQMHYLSALPSYPGLEESVYLYSADTDRSIVSLAQLLNGMFPETKFPGNESMMSFHKRSHTNDAWAGMTSCPALIYHLKTSFAMPESESGFLHRWHETMGQNWTWECHDCMMAASCDRDRWKEILGLPGGPDAPVVQEAWNVLGKKSISKYMEHQEAWKLMATRPLVEIYDAMKMQASGSGPPVAVWSTVDSTIIAMLLTLGIWDKVWPQFSEAVIFEVYNSKWDNRAYFRLLRRGEPVQACQSPTAEGLCDLDTWLPDDILAARNATLWAERCSVKQPDQQAGANQEGEGERTSTE